MKIRTLTLATCLCGLLLCNLAQAQSGQLATAMSEARITVENRADANGYIRIRLTPVGGQAVDASIDILDRMSENDIAADIEKALIVALGNAYRVDRSGGENVRIRKADRDTGADFELEIAFNTPGLTITIRD